MSWLIVFGGFLVIAIAYIACYMEYGREKKGVVEDIALTFGWAGQQLITIDGERYSMWLKHEDWPPIGSYVTHQPFRRDDGRGNTLRCTTILKIETTRPPNDLQ